MNNKIVLLSVLFAVVQAQFYWIPQAAVKELDPKQYQELEEAPIEDATSDVFSFGDDDRFPFAPFRPKAILIQ